MTNSKTTRRALLSSVVSLLLCFAMLIGTTFAWFTDSVSSVKNQIVAGNLDVELEYYVDGKWKPVNGDTNVFTGELWEPGHTEVVYLKVSNLGTLALKYQLGINIFSEKTGTNADGKTFKLSDYIYFGVDDGMKPEYETRDEAREAVTEAKKISEGYSKSSEMVAGAEEYIAMVVYMPENVGNEANYKTGTPAPEIQLGVNLLATQMEYEEDSFGPDYDANAGYKLIYTFDMEGDLTAFDPVYFNPNNTAGSGMAAVNGVAVVNAKGAFFFRDVDTAQYTYTVEYDVDASALTEEDSIAFETGDTDTWAGSNHITITKGALSIGPAANDTTGYVNNEAMGEQLHVVHTYSLNDEGKLVTTTTISDGNKTVNASKTVDSSATQIYWDVYDLSEQAGGKVSIDNFTFYSNASVEQVTETVAADEISDMTFADNTTYKLTGVYDEKVTIKVPANMNVVLDGSGATFNGQLEVTINRIADGAGELTDDRAGTYVLKNFKVNGSLSIGSCSVESLTVKNCKVEMMDFNASNTAVTLTGNTIKRVSAEAYPRHNGGTNDNALYFYADHYDLTMTNNTIIDTVSTEENLVYIQGNYEQFQKNNPTWTNSISMIGNTLTGNHNLVKLLNDVTYAPVAWPADYEITAAAQTLASHLFERNTTNVEEGKAVIQIHCRAAGVDDSQETELNNDILKAIANK